MKKRRVKAASSDFTPASLPHSRKDQFFFLLRNRLGTLFLLGLLLLAGLLPIIIGEAVKQSFDARFYASLSEGSLTEADYRGLLFLDEAFLCLWRCAFCWVFAVPVSGCLGILRDLLYSKNIAFREDYMNGVKENYGPVGLLLFFLHLLLCAGELVYLFFGSAILGAVLLSFGIILLPILFLAVFLAPFYEGNAFVLIRNAAGMYGKFLWKILLFSLSIIAVSVALTFLPWVIVEAVATAVLTSLGLPLALLFLMEVLLAFLDKDVNPKYFPELVNKGLFLVEDNDGQ